MKIAGFAYEMPFVDGDGGGENVWDLGSLGRLYQD